ncbi:MAG TPA: AraC family transcriptional regulator [Bacillota bacterium]
MTDGRIDYQDPSRTLIISRHKVTGHYDMAEEHFHNQHELYYLYSGERNYFIKDRTFLVGQGNLVLIPAFELHKTTDTGLPNHERMLIKFSEGFLQTARDPEIGTILTALGKKAPVFRLSFEEQQLVEGLFLQMLREAKERRPGCETLLRALLMQILIYVYRSREQEGIDPSAYLSPTHKKVSAIVRYINQHYAEDLTLTALAKRFFVSPYYLSRNFKKVTGFNLVDYLNHVRVKEAERYLRETRLKVIQIAGETGFGSIAQFGRVFKSITQMTPLEYRKRTLG